MDRISIVVPCFNEEEALPVYYREMKRVMGELSEVSFEILFVDDGSSDKTLEILKQLNAKDGRCEYLSFSRNFGKEAAIYAGLKHASGDYVATMDVDLQDPPFLLFHNRCLPCTQAILLLLHNLLFSGLYKSPGVRSSNKYYYRL